MKVATCKKKKNISFFKCVFWENGYDIQKYDSSYLQVASVRPSHRK